MSLNTKVEGTGPAVVFLHAFPLDGTMWHDNATAVRESGFRTALVDLPGFGSSPGRITSIAETSDAVAETLKAKDIEKAVICGLSMGGYVAMELYRSSPEMFAAAVFCDTTPEADSREKRDARIAAVREISATGTEAFMDNLAESMVSKTTLDSKPDIARNIRDRFARATPEAVCAAMVAMTARRASTEYLGSFAIPVLLLFGGDDPMLEDGRMMASRIPEAKLEVFEGAGHFSNLEASGRFNAAVTAFLADVNFE